ncbi:hypothetical protein XHC_3763 [Xanthomonas hortorum pv. carotae str. M081]|nr:hypothetical protein XHC_3763 [Xanthomonas hortorum pv. carotae str. M081]
MLRWRTAGNVRLMWHELRDATPPAKLPRLSSMAVTQ